ncbi:MAG TPA: PQQ-dependent sugar dehydrogenase [Actinomycetota bacterium]|nr:PQQ-dependent sugar dehydrogenase [Actinomycetota bacterium]
MLLVFSACRSEAPNSPTRSPGVSPTAEGPPTAPEGKPGNPSLIEVGEFSSPLQVTAPGSDPRLFVVEKTGAIRIVRDGQALQAAFLDLSGDVSNGSEQGLLSMAFSPDYANSGLFYVNYTDTQGHTRIVEFARSGNPDVADPASKRELLKIDQPYANHNGGLVLFDNQGNLLIGMGDGGSGGDPENRAQDLGTLLGKLLRIDPRKPSGGKQYGIPADNPYASAGNALPEIMSYGLRNPWRFWIEPGSGDLYLADVGQNRIEEINYVPAAKIAKANFGWRAFEGGERATRDRIDESNLVMPVHTYPNGGGNCAVTGGHVYSGEAAVLRGRYLYGDYCEGLIKSFRIDAGSAVDHQSHDALKMDGLSSFGVDAKGESYATSLSGKVYRIGIAA